MDVFIQEYLDKCKAGKQCFNIEEYFRLCRASFEAKIDSWNLPIGDIETNPHKIAKNLDNLNNMGEHLIIDFDNKDLGGLDAVTWDKDYMRIIKRNPQEPVWSYLFFRPRRMVVKKEMTNDKNCVLLFTEEGAAIHDDGENPEQLIESSDDKGKKKFYPLSDINKFDGFYNMVFNFHKKNSLILLYPKGSLYACNEKEKDSLLERFKL